MTCNTLAFSKVGQFLPCFCRIMQYFVAIKQHCNHKRLFERQIWGIAMSDFFNAIDIAEVCPLLQLRIIDSVSCLKESMFRFYHRAETPRFHIELRDTEPASIVVSEPKGGAALAVDLPNRIVKVRPRIVHCAESNSNLYCVPAHGGDIEGHISTRQC